jgi:hypothetical protein
MKPASYYWNLYKSSRNGDLPVTTTFKGAFKSILNEARAEALKEAAEKAKAVYTGDRMPPIVDKQSILDLIKQVK